MSNMTLKKTDELDQIMREAGISRYGLARLEKPFSISLYDQWLEAEYFGEMEYLVRHREQKTDPSLLFESAKSAIVVAVDYIPHPKSNQSLNALKVARYAQGADYHHWLKDQLETITKKLEAIYPEARFRSFTDSHPVLERDLAARAGLGWVGKNTCLIDQKAGSFFLIGEIYTTIELSEAGIVAADRCGTCTKCIDACPTQALIEPRVLDARRCISYLTIESKTEAPEKLRSLIGEHYFGCDICQDVCPWNQKAFGEKLKVNKNVQRSELIQEISEILKASNKDLERRFKGTPLTRAPAWAHKRNAIVVATNLRITEVKELVKDLSVNPRLSSVCEWSLGLLN